VRITFVLPFVNLTGGIRVLLEHANWLHDSGHDVTVAYPLWPYRFHFTRRQQAGEFKRELQRAPDVTWMKVRCRLKRIPIVANRFVPVGDLVIASAWPTVHDVARLDPSKGRKVHVVFHHESGTGPERRIRAIYEMPFRRIACASAVRDLMLARFGCEIHDVVPCGVDTANFFPDGSPRDDTVMALYHDAPRKGWGDAMSALERLRQRRPDVRIRVCGTVQPTHVPPGVEFSFAPSDAELRRLYSTSTLLLYPSRDEGFALPPLEAMACGCPVVTTAVGAVPEFARDGENACVVTPGDVNGMTDRMEMVLCDVQMQRKLSRCGLETASRFAMSSIAPLFEAALLRAIS
jgi:glycosyltransferase involved in cell wall biosynthesis